MGDELHSRNTAATLLFTRELFGTLLELFGDGWDEEARQALAFLEAADYFFLRCSMAAAKVLADALPVGPVLIGPAKPAHVVTPSVTARGIVNITAVAVVEAQSRSVAET